MQPDNRQNYENIKFFFRASLSHIIDNLSKEQLFEAVKFLFDSNFVTTLLDRDTKRQLEDYNFRISNDRLYEIIGGPEHQVSRYLITLDRKQQLRIFCQALKETIARTYLDQESQNPLNTNDINEINLVINSICKRLTKKNDYFPEVRIINSKYGAICGISFLATTFHIIGISSELGNAFIYDNDDQKKSYYIVLLMSLSALSISSTLYLANEFVHTLSGDRSLADITRNTFISTLGSAAAFGTIKAINSNLRDDSTDITKSVINYASLLSAFSAGYFGLISMIYYAAKYGCFNNNQVDSRVHTASINSEGIELTRRNQEPRNPESNFLQTNNPSPNPRPNSPIGNQSYLGVSTNLPNLA